ncbi:MAG: dihydroneopterin aldolase [Candidatus Limnocylindria bacterium]
MSELWGVLELRGLRCRGRHGAYPAERETERDFLVDLAVRADLAEAVRSDSLAAATDLAALAATAREAVAGSSRSLLERVAADVADAILERFAGADEVRVRVAKPDPLGLDAAEEAVELRRARPRARPSGSPSPSGRRARTDRRRGRG